MFRTKTLFVVGAGASAEAGLPVGNQLKPIIAKHIDIRFANGWTQDHGSHRIMDALKVYGDSHGVADLNPYLGAGWMIRDAMPLAISIDNFMEAHQDDQKIELCGKLAIVKSILEAERKSSLFARFPEKPKLEKLSETWFLKLFQMISENVPKGSEQDLFRNLSLVIFNYDRCVEHFLVNALSIYYQLSEEQAQQLVLQLPIVHPYGAVGPLNWQNREGVAFGAEVGGAKLLALSSKIRTFTERVQEETTLEAIRQQVMDAETVVFLGFSFQEMNMRLLNSPTQSNVKRVFGTAKGISDSDCVEISLDVGTMINKKAQHAEIKLRNELSCAMLLSEYWRTLRA